MKNKYYILFLLTLFTLFLVSCDKTTTKTITTIEPTSQITTEQTTLAPTTTAVYYTVRFMQDDIILKEDSILKGTSAIPPLNTEKDSTLEFSYTFNGWDNDFSNVQSDLVINAIYTQNTILYDVTFYDYDNETVVYVIKTPYNSSVTPPEDIDVRTDEIYTYTFDSWIGDLSNITGNTNIYSSYIRTYTTTGDYSHQDFYNLVSDTFNIENETNIENNISYLTEIFEAETEEEAYRVFNILTFNFNQLTEFNDFQEFQDIFINLESGFLTDERLINILFNYLKSSNSYFIGLSDLEFSWYNEVMLNYTNYQDQYNLIKAEQESINSDLDQALLTLNEELRTDGSNYFYFKVDLYQTEKAKFSYFDYLKSYIDRDAYDLNTAIWNILDKDNIDPLLYDFYLNQYNSICNNHPLYLDKIETYYTIMEEYYNANISYNEVYNIIQANSDYDSFISTANSLYSNYIQTINDYFLIKADIEYWVLQFNGIKAASEYLDLAREILKNTENEELYKEALLILIDDLENTVINSSDVNFSELSSLVTYIVNNQDMYGYLDTSTLFESITKEGLFNVFIGLSDLLDIRLYSIDTAQSQTINNALYELVTDYVYTLDIEEINIEQAIQTNYQIAIDYFSHFNSLINEAQNFIDSLTIEKIEKFEILVNNQDIYTKNEYTIELAKLINIITDEETFDINNFLESYMYINFFQVDVHQDISEIQEITSKVILRMDEFLTVAQYISTTDPSLITQKTLDDFYNEFNYWYHDFLFSYTFYLDN
ncbi:MAG: hypothetical protein AB7S96_02215 [Candidatus Izemoplasmatales bacterium]